MKTLKQLRLAKQLSQQELAGLSGISLRTIQRMEKNQSSGSPYVIRSLCTALQISPHELFTPKAAEPVDHQAEWAENAAATDARTPVSLAKNRHVKIINLGALSVLLFPFLNLVVVPVLYGVFHRKINAPAAREDALRIISFQIIWSLVTAVCLVMTPLLDHLIWNIGEILDVPLFLWLYLILLIGHIFSTLYLAWKLNQKKAVSKAFPNFF
ncbi:hypothetical protein C7T94_18235 [Pedobacter yulinensis]|uniref:HTH cro/C1-type domain-containing protein n=1 Tax=Pedobacter yulinensis TaxID=2126353 RepID=A0A2T3HH90_9SPHI|nr:helix-turn-helix domain-containing protein [Pedobacter yulinensis]PST81808.1 hypothetical protein C7T94_18235 [Pedobacter yulinensis]